MCPVTWEWRLADQIHLEMRLVHVRKTSAGSIELTFKRGASTLVRTHDAVVLAIPFTLLREVGLETSLGLPPEKLLAIPHGACRSKTVIRNSLNPILPTWPILAALPAAV